MPTSALNSWTRKADKGTTGNVNGVCDMVWDAGVSQMWVGTRTLEFRDGICVGMTQKEWRRLE